MTITRRAVLEGVGRAAAVGALLPSAAEALARGFESTSAEGSDPGHWRTTSRGLPAYVYTGPLPARSLDRTGADARENPDPSFLIGNDRITLFTRASGILEIITGERAWARVNAADTINYGANAARVTVDGTPHELVGLDSLSADPSRTSREFGCGYARHVYRISPTLSVRRVVSVAPSRKVGAGNPAFVVSVTITNTGPREVAIDHHETIRNHYVAIGEQKTASAERTGRYVSTVSHHADASLSLARTSYEAQAFAVAPDGSEASRHDALPVNVFLVATSPAGAGLAATTRESTDAELACRFTGRLAAGRSTTLQLVVGLTYGGMPEAVEQAGALLADADDRTIDEGLFARAWRERLPRYPREPDDAFRTEMTWNAHVLEAMATHSAYFDETFVPQGMIYAYEDGENISNRDNLQALLPLCYTNPALARSCLRYVFRHTTPIGEIKRGTGGFGYVSPSVYKESDEALYVFMALGEYLRVTGDHSILDDVVSYYPRSPGSEDSVLRMLQRHFVYLRDEVGTGPHGLIRILNSDWSDSFFHTYSPNVTAYWAESHLNSAMALAFLPRLIVALKAAGRSDTGPFLQALEEYRASLHSAYFKDLGDRDFSARAYLNDGKPSYGVDVVCLEPQGFLLQIPDLPAERKRAIYARVRRATLDPEKVGLRIRERPIFSARASGEDGGIWFALEHQVIAGVATFDRAEARRLLGVTSFHAYAQQYPTHSIGRWTNFDCMESTLNPREALQVYWHSTYRESGFGYCSHPHSWPLYNYHRLQE